MNQRLRRLRRVPRGLKGRAHRLRAAREERAFHPRLRFDPASPELLLSPHWDDAVLDCWSLLAGSRDLRVVNVFAGIPQAGSTGGWAQATGARDAAQRARDRVAEDGRALARAGRTPANLDLLDFEYRSQEQVPVGLEDVDRALAGDVQSASRLYVPAGIGWHADHLLVRRYGRMLMRSGMPVVLYAELPYCIFHGWPAWVRASESQANRDVDAYWRSFLRDVPELPSLRSARVERLDDPAAQAKQEAIACYETSLNYAMRRMLSDREFHGFEVFWELSPATH